MEVEINLAVKDWKSYQSFLGSEIPRKFYSGWWLGFANAVVWFLSVIIIMATINSVSSFHWPTAITITALFLLLIFNHLLNRPRFLLDSLAPDAGGPFCGKHTFKLSNESLKAYSDDHQSEHSWKLVKRVVRSHGLIMLFIDNANAYIFPENELNDADEFYLLVNDRVNEYNKKLNKD